MKQIKFDPPKSPQEIVDVLLEVLADARAYEIRGLAIAYTAKDFTHTEAILSGSASFPELMGVIDEVKERVRKEWQGE